ncbi:MAG: riboflavin synthase [Candidatus Peribacteraceae bacterium]
MFTGIIEATAAVRARTGSAIAVALPTEFKDVQAGNSISVSGVCLTVAYRENGTMHFDIVPETVRCTTLGRKNEGDIVNIERALPAHGRYDGHMVQGHIEGVGTVVANKEEGEGKRLSISVPEACARFVIPKGSICIDGVSLTVASVQGDCCGIALIPETCRRTTLGALHEGDSVNIETDILVRTIAELYDRGPRV